MISASHEERETLGCFLEAQLMQAEPNEKTKPVVECLTAQSESDIPSSGRVDGS